MTSLWEQVPRGLNAVTLKTLADDTSMELLNSLLKDFQGELESQKSIANQLTEIRDLKGLSNCFHTTKGLAATFGAESLRVLAETFEGQTQSGSSENLAGLLKPFCDLIDQTTVEVDQMLALLQNDT